MAITAVRLANVDFRSWQSVINPQQCLLVDGSGAGMCMYAYALGAVSIIFTLAIGLLQVRRSAEPAANAACKRVAGSWSVPAGAFHTGQATDSPRADLRRCAPAT